MNDFKIYNMCLISNLLKYLVYLHRPKLQLVLVPKKMTKKDYWSGAMIVLHQLALEKESEAAAFKYHYLTIWTGLLEAL